ncbi:MAG: L-aspartate oxidase [Eubacterium sp.]|nr:L-aspartate oxidase [Eubacterium sp.]
MKTDILIVGSGCSGLYCALHLPEQMQVTVITKSDLESSDSFLAQGGICMLRDEADYEGYFEDTMRAGHYENDRASVEIMIRSSRQVIQELVAYGVDFQREEDGSFAYTREGAHSRKRILFHKDITGKEITEKLLEQAKRRPNIELLEYTTMLDLVSRDNRCEGAVVKLADAGTAVIQAAYTILACGGIGGLYTHSTNYRHLTGDAVAAALRHHVALKNISYIQIHPTTLYTEGKEERSFLISESVRGEGAKLYDKNMQRFVNELLPRDELTAAILAQMEKDGTPFVWEDLRTIPKEELEAHFPNIVAHCAAMGYDVANECIPVVPAQHYFMGGIAVDTDSRTSMQQLYAIGETACNGVHGKNRLASNSLLESLVFAKRAAEDIAGKAMHSRKEFPVCVNLEPFQDSAAYTADNNAMVLQEISRAQRAEAGCIDGTKSRRIETERKEFENHV